MIYAEPQSLYSWARDAVPILQKAIWVPESVWTSAENVAPTGIQPPDRPSRSLVDMPTTLSQPTPVKISITELLLPGNNISILRQKGKKCIFIIVCVIRITAVS